MLDYANPGAQGNWDYLNTIEKSPLWSYCGRSRTVFHCPADPSLGRNGLAPAVTRVRSMSMNAFFGPYDSSRTGAWASGRNTFVSDYRQWLKLASVGQPSKFFVTIDEHADGINDAYFLNNPAGATQWGDAPASYHNGAAGISFADGHSEIHKWRSRASKFPVTTVSYNVPPFDALGREDYRWLAERTAVKF